MDVCDRDRVLPDHARKRLLRGANVRDVVRRRRSCDGTTVCRRILLARETASRFKNRMFCLVSLRCWTIAAVGFTSASNRDVYTLPIAPAFRSSEDRTE